MKKKLKGRHDDASRILALRRKLRKKNGWAWWCMPGVLALERVDY